MTTDAKTTMTKAEATAENASLLLGLLGRLDEFKTNMHGEIVDGEGGEWTPVELIEAIDKVREMIEEMDLLQTFAEKAKEMSE